MSLRLRLFLLFGSLVALLVLAQWWWVRGLTRGLSSELDQVASSVGRSVAAFFTDFGGAPAGRIVECIGDDCEVREVAANDADAADAADVADAAGTPHTVEILRFESDDVEAKQLPDGEMLIRRIRRGPTEAEADADAEPGHHGFAYEFEDRVEIRDEGEDGAPARMSKHVQIHVEREDGDPYLWMGAPTLSRRFQIPHQGMRQKLDRFSRQLVFGSVGFLALGLILAGVVAHRVTGPLRQLSSAARHVGEGALGTTVEVRADGEVGEAIGAFNHMSSRLQELDARSRELEARRHLGEIGEIARGLAHTLRNPLNALGLSVEELAAGTGGSDAAPELAESARRQIQRIDHSVRSFLALASQSGGARAEVDVGELIEDVALEALQDSRGRVRLNVEADEGLPRLDAVEPELRAVLQALVVNAVEASPEAGRVTVRATAAGSGRLRVEIEDDGEGLAEEVRERLFTPHLSTKANGSGMGLFLAHRIATTRYGGSLELLDREGQGTRAVLELGHRTPSAGEEAGR